MSNALDQAMTQALSRTYTRRWFLKGSLAAGAGALALTAVNGSFLAPAALAAPAPLDNDLDILNYALTLEFLEAAAYKAINDAGILSGRAATYFQAFGAHEQAHVDAVRSTVQKLGGTPVSPPAGGYNFSSVPQDQAGVVKFFQMVESVGASAYLGAAPSIQNADVLSAALSIHAVEAEHTSALADLVAPGTNLFAPEAFATPRTPAEVMQIVAPFFATTAPAPSPSPAPQPAPQPSPAPMPGLPNTGAGGAAGGNMGGLLEMLGLFGVGAAAVGVLARRSAARAEEQASRQDGE